MMDDVHQPESCRAVVCARRGGCSLPDAWLSEDEAAKPVEKQLSELGPWGFHRLMSALPDPPPRDG
jgi:hypothetical protein